MASQAFLDKMQLRQNYRNLWHTDLMGTVRADFPLGHVSRTCFANELFTMTCQGTHVVRGIYHAVEDVEKVDAQSFAFALRFSCALEILLPQLASCSKMSSTYRLLNVITALLVCACMQTQHKIELDKRDGMFGPAPVMAVPPFQQMSRIDQPIPPPAGYAPSQPAYGQPYGYPPPAGSYPPPAGSYPPQGYPPAGYYPK
ncbi:hypothetical protein ZIOFF_034902 [Zingiber officinale]|uniref:Uncharacterized protein n=1 Tax=Zingiber officinale TaxID=94328 RepID=A0A8J5L2A0_ZINOF|nr:hypothetical protein ZIOFF_034902 [Zingiber officinale]